MASTYFRWPNGMAHFLNVPDDRGAWGRWGYRNTTPGSLYARHRCTNCSTGLFEGERDLDTSCDIDNTFTGGELELTRLVNQSDMLAPPDSQQYYKTAEYREVLGELVAHTRSQLDTGNTGNKLFDQFRAREQEPNGLYRMIIVGALMMRTGAKIRDEDIRYLRDLATRVDCKPGWAPPHDDSGFRGPGKAQFLAALDNYQAGTPRNFEEPRCV